MTERIEIERRIVQETEMHDILAEIETQLRQIETGFARVTIEPVTVEKHRANERLAKAVKETDVCLNCGDPIDKGGFCGYQCLTEVGDD